MIDQTIAEYAARCREVYERRTAGDYTFEGILADFARNARLGGVEAERQRILLVLNDYAESMTKGIPPHIGLAFRELITGAVGEITPKPAGGQREGS